MPADVAGDLYSISSSKSNYALTTGSNINVTQFWQFFYNDIVLKYKSYDIGRLLNLYNVKYLIVHTDLTGGKQREAVEIIKFLSLQKDISILKQIGPYFIFKNLDYNNSMHPFFSPSSDSYAKFLASRLSNSTVSYLNIPNMSDWSTLKGNNNLSIRKINDESAMIWNTSINSGQGEAGIVIKLKNKNIENFDRMKVDLFVGKNNSGRQISVVLYTNTSQYYFTRYDLKPGQLSQEVFDMRASENIYCLSAKTIKSGKCYRNWNNYF